MRFFYLIYAVLDKISLVGMQLYLKNSRRILTKLITLIAAGAPKDYSDQNLNFTELIVNPFLTTCNIDACLVLYCESI
jgi:hypothetical protein